MPKKVFCAILAAGVSFLPMAAAAQSTGASAAQPEAGIADIIVTAQRRSESLQKVPIAVTALNSEALETRNITSISSLGQQITPGVIVSGYAGNGSSIIASVRGVSPGNPSSGLAEQGVAIYVDGIPLGRANGIGIELGDIERVEVLRGPQGTLFGRNAQGGAIQYITSRPTGELGGKIQAEYGNYDSRRVVGHLNLPSFGNVSVKLSGLVAARDGYVKNRARGAADLSPPNDPFNPIDDGFRPYDESEHRNLGLMNQKGFRATVMWEPTTDFTAVYSYDYSDLKYTNDLQVRAGGRVPSETGYCFPGSPLIGYCTPGFQPANPADVYTGTTRGETQRAKVSKVPQYQPLSSNRTRGHTLTLEWNANDNLALKSITGYRMMTQDASSSLADKLVFVQFLPATLFDGSALNGEVGNGTLVGVSGIVPPEHIDQDQLSQELQAIYTSDHLNLTVGGFYYREKLDDERDSLFQLGYYYNGTPGVLNPVSVAPFTLGRSSEGNSTALQAFRARADSYAAYAQGTWTPAGMEDLHITAGLRFTHDKKFFRRLIFQGLTDGLTTSTFKASRVDPAFVIAYDVTPDVNVYGKYSSAYRAGGVNIRNKVNLQPYDAEVNKAFEVGVKSQFWDRRVRWNLAAYRSRINGSQVENQNSASDPASTATINLDRPLKIWGIESELTVSPLEGLTLAASYAYMEAKGQEFVTSGPTLQRFVPTFAPKHQLQLAADYRIPLDGDITVALHGDYNYMSKSTLAPLRVQGALAGSVLEPSRTLHTTNVRLAVEDIPLGSAAKATIALYGQNIFDVNDYEFTFVAATSDIYASQDPGGNALLNRPRTYGISAKVEF